VLRGLVGVRWLILVLQAVIAAWLVLQNDHRNEPIALLGLCGGLAAVEVSRLSGMRPAIAGHVTLDIAFLGLFTAVWGPHHPLVMLSLVEVALAATVLDVARTTWVVVAALGLMVTDGIAQASAGDDWLHVGSHVGISGLAVVALGGFAHGLGRTFRKVEDARRTAIEDRERGGRLALVGTLASGVAHELGTPLGSITLLAEEVALDLPPDAPAHETLAVLQSQVDRCRGILDRLLLAGHAEINQTPRFLQALRGWVDEWAAANPQAGPALDAPHDDTLAVQGSAGDWRSAVWTVLDNGKKAGLPLRIAVSLEEGAVVVIVDDEGPGPSDDVAAHAGEPFYTGWSGRGLGLYAVRTQLERVGGRFVLARREGGGGRATLVFPLAEEAD
jgi:two-component system sensor histidine kinase RegB